MTNFRIGVIVRPNNGDRMQRFALLAERAGFDSLWIPDHIILRGLYDSCLDCWSMIPLIAKITSRVTISSAVSDPFRRHPSVLAHAIATLDSMFPGRIFLGLGGGESMNLLPYGFDNSKPLTHLRETIQCIRGLWTSSPDKPFTFEGSCFSLKDSSLSVERQQATTPPIYLGVFNNKGRELVGELGDGWYPMLTTPTTYSEDSKEIRESARKVGRNPEEIDCIARACTYVLEDDADTARQIARRDAKMRLIQDPVFVKRLDPETDLENTFDVRKSLIARDLLHSSERVAARISDEIADKICAAGKPDDCISYIEEYLNRGARHIVIATVGPRPEKIVSIYGKRIIPYLKEKYA